jgi:flagellar protein FliO/FliZ
MMKFLLSILLLLGSNSFAAGAKSTSDNQLIKITSEEKDGKTYVHFATAKSVDIANVEAHFLRRSVEFDFASVGIKKDKMFVDIGSGDINNVYVSYNDEKSVRVRVNLDNGKTASNYHERISFLQEKNGLAMVMDSSAKLITSNIKELNRTYEVATSSEKQIAEHMSTASVLKVGGTVSAAAAAAEVKASDSQAAASAAADDDENEITLDDSKSEELIPLKIKDKSVKSATGPAVGRMLAGLAAIALLLGSVVLIGKKVNRKRLGSQFNHESIVVVSQKFLGPKRNLTLVRVSGEYLLLGVTDNNISLIKTLAIVDDEIPALTPNDFGSAVKDMTAKAEGLEDMIEGVEDSFAVSSLTDVKKMFRKRKYIDE